MVTLKRQLDAHTDQRLHTEPVIWLSSTRPDGHPHVIPVWFLWDGSTILIFSLPHTQKLRNIQRQPLVMLSLDSARQGDDIVMLEGHATLLDDPTLRATIPAFASKYASLMTSITPEQWANQFSQAIRISPIRFLCWAK